MEIIIRIDSTKPINSDELRANAAWLISIADDPEFFTRYAPGASATATPTPPLAVQTGSVGGVPTPPAPAAPVPDVPSVPAAPAAPVSDLDADGLPWDERIHSSGKSRTAKGVWTKRKGVDNATYASVSVELRNRVAGTAGATPVVPAAPAAPVPEVPAAPTLPVPAAPAAVPSVPAAPAAPTPANVPGVPIDILAINQAVQAGRIAIEELNGVLQAFGASSISDLFTNETARSMVAAHFRSQSKIV